MVRVRCDLCTMRTFTFVLVLLHMVVLNACGQPIPDNGCKPPSHKAWDDLLRRHVRDDGFVSYAGLKKDSLALNSYLSTLSKCPPSKSWNEKERLAYWINAYNAFTVQLIIRHHPVKSIKDIGPKLAIPLVNSVWDVKFIDVSGVRVSLNRIEHEILRKEFNEPRIHFAIVCASYSCPTLLNRAFTAEAVGEAAGRRRPSPSSTTRLRNRISNESLELSSIFNWFKGDFTKDGTLPDYIKRYAATAVTDRPKVSFMDYDWSLNGE
jgi:hypothetical protein